MDEETTNTAESGLAVRLVASVQARIKEAMDARRSSGIEEIWDDDTDQYNGIDDLSAVSRGVKDQSQVPRNTKAGQGRSRVFLNITKPKTDAGIARVQEMLLPHDDKPWGIEPTPIPDLQEAIENDSDEPVDLGNGVKAPAKDVAVVALEKASKAAEKMADWIEDRFVEGSVYAEMRAVVRDAGRIGTGVLKGPFPKARETRKWVIRDGITALVKESKPHPTSKRVDPRDFFPDPSCGEDIHQGSYCVERDYLTARQLRGLAKDPGYDSAAIAAALKEGPTRGRDLDRFQDNPGETIKESEVFECFYYYGDVDPATLLELGVSEDELGQKAEDIEALVGDEIYLQSMPAIVTMLNGRAIKAAINPVETGEFPYDLFVWEPVDGQPWGRGLPRKISTAQKILNAGVRALLENAGLSAGAQIVITSGCIKPAGGGSYAIEGRKLWEFTPNELVKNVQDAMHVFTISSVQQELSAIIEFALKMADELTNLPLLLQGQSNREGGASTDTFGGMTLAMNAANAPLRVIAKQFDDRLVVPHLRRYYDLGMQVAPDDCKGDLEIQARGSTALLQRELENGLLMQAQPLVADPALRIDPAKWAAELFRSQGFNLASIQYTDDEWRQKQEEMAQQPQPQDPRIEAANIRAQADAERIKAQAESDAQDRQLKAAEGQAMREVQVALAQIQRDIQVMRLAGDEKLSIESIKADLAAKAIDSRDKRELFAAERTLKMDPENPTNEGI